MKPGNLLRWTTRLGAIAALQTSVFFMLTPARPLQAATGDQFKVCAEELQEAGLSPEKASTACADALRPKDLSLCVLSMNQEVGISADTALSNCYRDRRPLDLASCVVNINDSLKADNMEMIVENCRRSLLPLRYSECVVGLTNTPEQDISPVKAAQDCLDAQTFPSNLNSSEQ
ncbi:MAG: hypothetical protein ABEI32_07830 [Halothece sp.]